MVLMKALQWMMTIPKEKQAAFVRWFREVVGPELAQFGAVKHELYQVEDKQIVGKQVVEANRFVERVYFKDDFEIAEYFARVKNDPKAWRISRMYEREFGAVEIELRVISELG